MATTLYCNEAAPTTSPTAGEKSSTLPVGGSNSDSGSGTERSLSTSRGSGQQTLNWTTAASTAQQSYYLRRFSSPALAAQTISSGSWSYYFIAAESNAAANIYHRLSVYVWRPGTSSVVGFVYDATADLGVEVNNTGQSGTFSGSSVTAQDGDILVCELWAVATQSMATSYTGTIYYDAYASGGGANDLRITTPSAVNLSWYTASTYTNTHTTDAILKGTLTKTHTTDAVLKGSVTKSHTTDAYLASRSTKAHTTDALLLARLTKTHTTDAALKGTVTKTHTTDARLFARLTKTHTTDALLLARLTKAHTTDAALRGTLTRTHTTDAALRAALTRTHTTDARLFARLTKTHSTDAFLAAAAGATTKFHTTDALLRATLTKSHTTDARLFARLTQSHTTNFVLRATSTRAHTTDAYIVPGPLWTPITTAGSWAPQSATSGAWTPVTPSTPGWTPEGA